jgi:hydrogenase/urease accessory protein HupE
MLVCMIDDLGRMCDSEMKDPCVFMLIVTLGLIVVVVVRVPQIGIVIVIVIVTLIFGVMVNLMKTNFDMVRVTCPIHAILAGCRRHYSKPDMPNNRKHVARPKTSEIIFAYIYTNQTNAQG